MTSRKIYAWLLRRHPHAFRDRFERDMLWLFDETVAERGGTRLLIDALASLVRQSILRSRENRKRTAQPAEAGAVRDVHQSIWRRGLTPEVHLLIVWAPFGMLWAHLRAAVQKDSAWDGIATVFLLEALWFLLYRRRLKNGPPLAGSLSVAHLPLRDQLENSLKSIGGGLRVRPRRLILAGVVLISIDVLWNFLVQRLGYPSLALPFLFPGICIHVFLGTILNRYAADKLEAAIRSCPQHDR